MAQPTRCRPTTVAVMPPIRVHSAGLRPRRILARRRNGSAISPAFRLPQLPGPVQSRGNCELLAITCPVQLGRYAAPPLTRRIWPLTQDAPGLTRYATA